MPAERKIIWLGQPLDYASFETPYGEIEYYTLPSETQQVSIEPGQEDFLGELMAEDGVLGYLEGIHRHFQENTFVMSREFSSSFGTVEVEYRMPSSQVELKASVRPGLSQVVDVDLTISGEEEHVVDFEYKNGKLVRIGTSLDLAHKDDSYGLTEYIEDSKSDYLRLHPKATEDDLEAVWSEAFDSYVENISDTATCAEVLLERSAKISFYNSYEDRAFQRKASTDIFEQGKEYRHFEDSYVVMLLEESGVGRLQVIRSGGRVLSVQFPLAIALDAFDIITDYGSNDWAHVDQLLPIEKFIATRSTREI